jgi:RNA polymerase sigma factor (sigma-70 family)
VFEAPDPLDGACGPDRKFLTERVAVLPAEIDQGTVSAAVSGDTYALSTLLHAHGPLLHRHFTDRIGRRHQAVISAEDVLQVTFMEAFLRIRSFVPAGENSFLAWLRQIGENNLRDAVRELDADKRPPERKRITTLSREDSYTTFLATLAGSFTTPTEHLRRSDAKALLEAAMKKLPQDYAQVLRLYHLKEQHIDEVAAAFDPPRSRGAVHMLRLRAFECLRELLGQPERFLTTSA